MYQNNPRKLNNILQITQTERDQSFVTNDGYVWTSAEIQWLYA